MAEIFADLLTEDGSIVIELRNAWEPERPVQSLLHLESLLGFVQNPDAELRLCQQFICYNPSRLPSPAQWVTVERIRVKDAFTRVWWLSPVERPKANNLNILTEYSKSMQALLERGTYNSGPRPSEHHIGKKSFLSNNGGAIPPNVVVPGFDDIAIGLFEVLPISNTRANDPYQIYCRRNGITPHPARMQAELASFFIKFLSDKRELVLDPFAGSNTTGAVSQQLGRRWLSIELNPDYITSSRSRVGL